MYTVKITSISEICNSRQSFTIKEKFFQFQVQIKKCQATRQPINNITVLPKMISYFCILLQTKQIAQKSKKSFKRRPSKQKVLIPV